MPCLKWSELSAMQLGRYAEYYAKMEFASYGFDVYTSEVDDHGVDFIVKSPTGVFYEIQVKSVRDYNYTYILKSKMKKLTHRRLVCYLNFKNDRLPDVFVIPSTVWDEPNEVFVDREYSAPGLKSKPEWGIQVSKKNYELFQEYRIEKNIYKIVK